MHPPTNPIETPPSVRRWLLILIGLLLIGWGPGEDDTQALIEQLGDRNWKVRQKAEAKLFALGEEAAETLRAALKHPDAEIRWRAEKLLRNMSWRVPEHLRERVGDLFDEYEDLGVDERLYVVDQVAERLGTEGIGILLRIGGKDEEPEVRSAALMKAHGIGGKEVEERILQALAQEKIFWAYRWSAFLRKARGEPIPALDACRAAVAMNPHDPELNAIYVALLQSEGLWEEATTVLEVMKGRDAENPLYRILLVRAYEETDRSEDAEREIEAAVEMEPVDLQAYITLITTCIDIGKLDLAFRFISNSEANHPGEPGIQALRAQVHEERGEWDPAFRFYSLLFQASDREGSDFTLWREKVREIMGHRGEGDLVNDDLLDEIHRRRLPVGLWVRLGAIYREKGLREFATEEFRRALIFKRKDPGLLLQLAETFHEMGDAKHAAEAAERALALEELAGSARVQLEKILNGEAPAPSVAGMAPLLWEWRARLGEEWPRSPDRNRFSWKVPPVAAGNTIVSAVYGSDTVVGVDAASGRRIWRQEPPAAPPAPPSKKTELDLAWMVSDDGTIYLIYNVWHSVPGKFRLTGRNIGLLVIALDPTNGDLLRTFEVEGGIGDVPSNSAGGKIALTQGRGISGRGIALLDLLEGELAWSHSLRGLSSLPTSIEGNRVWVALEGGILLGLDLETGEESWRRDFGSSLTTSPVTRSDGIYLSTSKGKLLRIDRDAPKPVWETDLSEVASGMAMIPGGLLVVAHRGGAITCWEANGGTKIWRATPGRSAERAFAGGDGQVLALNGGRNAYWPEEGELLAIDTSGGQARWRLASTLGANLLLSGDRAVLADGDLRNGFRLAALAAVSGPPDPDLVARALRLEARALAADRDRGLAAAILRRVLLLSEKPEPYIDLAGIYRAQREYKRAKEVLDRGSQMAGADVEAFDALRAEIDAEVEARKAARKKKIEEIKEAIRKRKEEQDGPEEPEEEGPPQEGLPVRSGRSGWRAARPIKGVAWPDEWKVRAREETSVPGRLGETKRVTRWS